MFGRKASEPPAPKLPPLTDATCSKLKLSLKPRIVGWSASTRQLIEKRLQRGVLAVRYVKQGWKVQLIPLPACKIPVKYVYERVNGKKAFLISSSGALWQELPLLAKKYAQAIASRRAIKVFAETSGLMKLPADAGIHRDDLDSRQCNKATHVIKLAALGRLAVVEGDKDEVEDYSGLTMPKSPLSVVEFSGDSRSCRDQRLIRPPNCRSPIRLILTKIKMRPKPQQAELIRIPAGTYLRGPSKTKVHIDAFDIDQTEVTAAAYDDCVESKKCTPAKKGPLCTSGILGKENHPINCVSWRQARAFCKWRKQRLPTEAEWEKAARGTDARAHVWGNEWPPPSRISNFADKTAKKHFPHWQTIKNYNDRYPGTAPVTAFGPGNNVYGVAQMAGNVSVWTADWYQKKISTRPQKNPRGPRSGLARVVRGSTFGHQSESQLLCSRRDFYRPKTTSMHIGIRCAR